MSFNVLKKAPYGSKSKKELSAPVIRFPFSYSTNDREREWEKRPRSPGIRLSTPTSLAGRLIARLPVHVQLAINANVGILLVASSQIFMVGMGLSAKYFVSTTEISTLTLIMVRMLITAACCIGWLAAEGKEEHVYLGPPAIRKLLVWRGLTGFASLYASMQSLRGLSVSDSTTIQFLAPNLTAALGFVMLGETLGWRDIVAGMTCLGGVMLISRPAFLFGVPAEIASGAVGTEVDPAERTAAVIWALISVACSALSYISIRRIGKRAHAMHSMLYFCYGSIVPCFLGLIFHIPSFVFIKSWREFNLIMIIGFFGFAGQILLTSGIQREKVGRATLATYLALLYSLILELYIFRTIPPFLSILGAGIIITSAVWVVMHRDAEPPDNTKIASPKPSKAKVYDEELGVAVSRTVSPVNFGNESKVPKAKRGELFQSYGRAVSPGIGAYAQPQPTGDRQGHQAQRQGEKEGGLLKTGWADNSRRRSGNLSD